MSPVIIISMQKYMRWHDVSHICAFFENPSWDERLKMNGEIMSDFFLALCSVYEKWDNSFSILTH